MKNAMFAALLTLSVSSLFAQSPESAPNRQPAPAGARRETPPAPDTEDRAEAPRDEPRNARPPADAKDKISTTQHSVTIGGQTINYTARSGFMIMRDEEGKPRASFFFTSYTKDGADPSRRPVTYTFNGGPGSSSCGCTWAPLVRSASCMPTTKATPRSRRIARSTTRGA